MGVLEDFAESAPTQGCVEDLDRAFARALEGLGFPVFTYGNVMMEGEVVRHCHATTVDPAWWEHYVAENYAMVDPLLAELPYRSGAYTWEETLARASARGFQCIREAEEAGLTHGLAVALRRPGSLHALSLAGRDRPATPLERAQVLGIAEIYHECRRALGVRDAKPFTTRQEDYLHWQALGKNAIETAQICGVTADTVKRMLGEARARIGADGRFHATSLALLTGSILPPILHPQTPPQSWDTYLERAKEKGRSS